MNHESYFSCYIILFKKIFFIYSVVVCRKTTHITMTSVNLGVLFSHMSHC